MLNKNFTKEPAGLSAFLLLWFGQVVSILATQMTLFATTLWAFEKTGSATALGLLTVFFVTPLLVISPFAGAMVDRYNRKLMMMLSDIGAGAATILLLYLQTKGVLQIRHLYLAAVISGIFNAFQWPAFSASMSLMVPKHHLARTNGLMALLETGPGVLAPLLAGILLPIIHFTGILLLDAITFSLAILAIAFVTIPEPIKDPAELKNRFWKEMTFGFRYIFKHTNLLKLQILFFIENLFYTLGFTVLAPMILLRTHNSEISYAAVQTTAALGGIAGALFLTVWGGFKKRIHGVLLGWIGVGMFWALPMGLGNTVLIWTCASFAGALFGVLIDSSNQSIWQTKVAPTLQGRVFAARRLIAWSANPITPIIAGLLADRVLEPGREPGSGMARLFVAAGFLMVFTGILGYFSKSIRTVEIKSNESTT